MKDKNKKSSIWDSSPERLSELVDSFDKVEHLWMEDELEAVFKHQLSTPVRVDLAGVAEDKAMLIKTLADAQGLTIKSFSDVLHHPNPPLELLIIIKDFAKRSRKGKHATLPDDIASVLYIAAIACAIVRKHKKITSLPDDELLKGLIWARSRKWIDDDTKSLLKTASKLLKEHKEAIS